MTAARLRRMLFSYPVPELSRLTEIPERTLERYKQKPYTIPLNRLQLLIMANNLSNSEILEVVK